MSKKLKVCHVLFSGLGGHGNVFFSMVDADKEKHCDYSAVFMGVEPVKEEYVQKCNAKGIPFEAVQKKPGFDTKAFWAVYRSIKKMRPDILFLHTPTNILPAILYRFRGGFRAKIMVRETQPPHLKTFREWVGLYLSFFFAKRIFYLTQEFYTAVKKRAGIFFPKRKSRVIPNGIDLSVFTPGNEIGFDAATVVLGMQGRLYKTKDHSTLLKSFSLLRDKPYYPKLRLHIAGDGAMREELETLAKELAIDDKVRFLGMLKEKELAAFLRSLGIYIHASLGETMSTAIMQVMACRLPVIASDIFGINGMVINRENGILVPPKDPAAMANAIDELYTNAGLCRQLALTGYHYAVEKFSNERMWADYKKEFDNC